MSLFNCIKMSLEIILGIAILIGIAESFKLEGEKKFNQVFAITVLLLVEVILIRGY